MDSSPFAIRNSLFATSRSRLHLRDGLRQKLVHMGADLGFGDGNSLGRKVVHQLADDGRVAAFAKLGGDHVPGIGACGVARYSKLRSRPQPEQAIAAGLSLELLLLVERELLLEGFLALVECGHGVPSDGVWRPAGLVAARRRHA